MSASEKLRALVAAVPNAPLLVDVGYHEYEVGLPSGTLPLIADLSAAVESVLNEAWIHGENEPGVEWARDELRGPYYALQKHLERGGVT